MFCALCVGSVWALGGFLMVRGYAQIVTHPEPKRCKVRKYRLGRNAGGEVGGGRGDDFCVPAA